MIADTPSSQVVSTLCVLSAATAFSAAVHSEEMCTYCGLPSPAVMVTKSTSTQDGSFVVYAFCKTSWCSEDDSPVALKSDELNTLGFA